MQFNLFVSSKVQFIQLHSRRFSIKTAVPVVVCLKEVPFAAVTAFGSRFGPVASEVALFSLGFPI
jgi:hypothetical protein